MNARAPKRSSIRPLTARSSSQQVAVAAQRRGGVDADVGRVGERADRVGAAYRRGRDGLHAGLGPRDDDLGREDLVVVEAHVDAGADQGRGRRRHRGAARQRLPARRRSPRRATPGGA
jgi:hypothetical protein